MNPTARIARQLATTLGSLVMLMDTPACAAPPAFDIPRLAAVVIDGAAADWEAAGGGFRVELLAPVAPPVRARAEFGAAVRLGWADAGLLVFATVTGQAWTEADKPDQLWSRDSIELYLAPAAGESDICQWLIAPGLDARFPEPRVFFHDSRRTPGLKQRPAAAQVARIRTATGYQLEALLPWSALDIDPAPGRAVAFQIMANHYPGDDQPLEHLLWFPRLGAFQDSRIMHTLRLAATSHPPLAARAVGRVNQRAARTEFEVFAPARLAGHRVRVRAAGAVLATGRLRTDPTGYARAQLTGPFTTAPVVCLEVNNRPADVVPLALPARASPARAWTIDTGVRIATAPVALTLVLPPAESYRIARREPGQPWTTLAAAAPGGEFRDAEVLPGRLYEYAVTRPGPEPATDYFHAGHELPVADQRGGLLLLVEQTQAAPLAAELHRLTRDLVGDGWRVTRQEVAASESPFEIKQRIKAEFERAPTLNTLFLLGRVPVPYAGNFQPDGHGDHAGAWPADVYYGALDGPWTDDTVNHPIAGRQSNVPGDGKLDQSQIPGVVRLAVGRVDFSALPAFAEDETTLLRRYLDRNHAYRQSRLAVAPRALVQDNFHNHRERFAYSGWQNFTTLVGPAHSAAAEWPNIAPEMHLFFYGCGAGGLERMAGFGDTAALVATPLNAVFSFLFGSYFGDWDTPNNLLRAALASAGGALTCGWAGRPHWYLHPLGLGATIGDCLRLTQNNAGDYQPPGGFARGVHIALLGDPTLRMHRVAPPTDLRARAARGGLRLSWRASPAPGARYHVYRAIAEFGPYQRLTEQPLAALQFDEPQGTSRDWHMVRAVALQATPTGSYHNASPGVFHGPRGD